MYTATHSADHLACVSQGSLCTACAKQMEAAYTVCAAAQSVMHADTPVQPEMILGALITVFLCLSILA